MAELQLGLPGGERVAVLGVGLLCPAGIGEEGARGGRPGVVPGFRPQAYITDRKSLKLMTRSVQLGVSAIRLALAGPTGWEAVPAPRRGLYVGATPQAGEPDDLRPALDIAWTEQGFDLSVFGEKGIPLIHPLWLVRGLSNNVLGFGSAAWDFQGTNMSYCDGDDGGWNAILEGAWALVEGRADLVVAGASDALTLAEPLLGGRRCGEGAAFVTLRRAEGLGRVIPLDRGALSVDEPLLGYLGAAAWPVALARHLLAEGSGSGL
jgi:hypothetical protein